MVATVEPLMTTDMFYGRHHDLVNHYIIYISLMTTDMFYRRHHDLVNHYIIYISLMTTGHGDDRRTYPWSLVR
jgi:hypothetical protein